MWPAQLYTAAQSRELDAKAIASGIDGYALMCRAGQAAFNYLLRQWALPTHIHIFCGGGNNGGDGLVMARLAKERGIPVSVYMCGSEEKLTGEALKASLDFKKAGLVFTELSAAALHEGVIVDAILGTGLHSEVSADYQQIFQKINASDLPVLAIDIPSGICSDTGRVLGAAVKADKTITFIGAKRGLFTAEAPEYTGSVLFDALAIPEALYEEVDESVAHNTVHELLAATPNRPEYAHKGMYGHVLVVGGNFGMAGAVMMAAESAARTGAGLVSVATQQAHIPAILARRPEAMAHGVVSGQELEPLLDAPNVIVLGPGLGQTPWSDQMLQKVMKTDKPVVLDADGLNLLAEGRVLKNGKRDNWVLTPHPGEAARLLGISTAEVQADRFASAEAIQQRYGGTVVLKGAGSIIASEGVMALCSYGNAGMASGGMGDLLSGLIGGLLAQGVAQHQAAALAVALHAKAGDLAAAELGPQGLLATDLLPYVRMLINGKA